MLEGFAKSRCYHTRNICFFLFVFTSDIQMALLSLFYSLGKRCSLRIRCHFCQIPSLRRVVSEEYSPSLWSSWNEKMLFAVTVKRHSRVDDYLHLHLGLHAASFSFFFSQPQLCDSRGREFSAEINSFGYYVRARLVSLDFVIVLNINFRSEKFLRRNYARPAL